MAQCRVLESRWGQSPTIAAAKLKDRNETSMTRRSFPLLSRSMSSSFRFDFFDSDFARGLFVG